MTVTLRKSREYNGHVNEEAAVLDQRAAATDDLT
jgi:hypothetical protein